MVFGWLKSLTPRSLIGRTALILLVPILTIQVVVSYVFIQRLYENVTEQMTHSMGMSLKVVRAELNAADTVYAALLRTEDMRRMLDVDVSFDADLPGADHREFYDLSGRTVMARLRRDLAGVGAIVLDDATNRVRVVLTTRHGPALFEFSRRRVSASNPHQLLVLMVFVSTVVTLISFLFLKNQVRPIRRLAQAAQAFGTGRVLPYRPSGAAEVRLAGEAFLNMRDRIERHIEQRTLMLSGVSHDLRTPLTRMKLELSMLEDSEMAEALSADVAEMQRMLDTFLDFARLDATEKTERVDPVALARALAERADRAGAVTFVAGSPEGATMPLRPMAVERALDNLIRNALRHGDRVRVTATQGAGGAVFRVEDDGPGIPPELRAEAVRPFARLDAARNLDKGGSVGLGLSIVRDIARQHGGGLTLADSPDLGGLLVELRLAR